MDNSDTNIEEEAIGPSRLLKRTVSCFGKGKPFYLLTLIQGSTIPYGIQSVGQLVTRIGLCSCSDLPVRAETSSTCWVFTLNSFVLNLILALNYYAVPCLLICSLSGYQPEEARVRYLETCGALNSRSISVLANFC